MNLTLINRSVALAALCLLPGCQQLMGVPGQVLKMPGQVLNMLPLVSKNEKKQKEAMDQLVAANAKEAKDRLGAAAVGEVSYVDAESGFILIRQLSGQKIPASTPLGASCDQPNG
jgi:hypothetical protein